MNALRRYSYIGFAVACLHLVFGAIVRISGSGMGCGDHWPKCYGRWFPPLDRPDLIIEVSHRYLASILLFTLIGVLVAAWRRRDEPGVAGPRGIIRPAALAVTLGVSAALLGAVTVKLGNVPFATLAHWTVAMSLVATVVATVIRTGGLGGATARDVVVTGRAKRASFAAATMALLTVVMGGLTAKYPGAAVACPSFPLCGTNPDVQGAAVHVQLTHRVLAVIVVLHLFGLVMGLRKRREPAIFRRAAHVALGLGVLQLLVAGAMIGMHLPPVLRSLHEATGVSIWIATFALAYLARISGDGHGVREPRVAPVPNDLADAGVIRTGATPVFSTAVAEARAVEVKEPWQSASPAVDAWKDSSPTVDVWHDGTVDDVFVVDAPRDVTGTSSLTTDDTEDTEEEHTEELQRAAESVVAPLEQIVVEAAAVAEEPQSSVLSVSSVVDARVLVRPEELDEPAPVEFVAAAAADDVVLKTAAIEPGSHIELSHEQRASLTGTPTAEEPSVSSLAVSVSSVVEDLPKVPARSKLPHSIAVIIARGADL